MVGGKRHTRGRLFIWDWGRRAFCVKEGWERRRLFSTLWVAVVHLLDTSRSWGYTSRKECLDGIAKDSFKFVVPRELLLCCYLPCAMTIWALRVSRYNGGCYTVGFAESFRNKVLKRGCCRPPTMEPVWKGAAGENGDLRGWVKLGFSPGQLPSTFTLHPSTRFLNTDSFYGFILTLHANLENPDRVGYSIAH